MWQDDKLWVKATYDKEEQSSDISLVFLPALNEAGDGFEEISSLWYRQYSAENNGVYYIAESRKMMGAEYEDAMQEFKGFTYKNGNKMIEAFGQSIKLNKRHIYNVFVVDDPANPENNGRVCLFQCPSSVHEMIKDKVKAKENVLDPFNPTVFHLKLRPSGQISTYETSETEHKTVKEVFGTEKALGEVLKKTNSIEALKDEKHYRTYQQTVDRLIKFLGSKMVKMLEDEGWTNPVKFPAEIPVSDGSEAPLTARPAEEVGKIGETTAGSLDNDEIPTFDETENPDFDKPSEDSDENYDFQSLLND